jgi:hydrogenase maturation protease
MTDRPSVVVAGVGNLLMQDDGIGVWTVRALARDYVLPPRVRLIDGGVLGLQLVHELRSAQQLLIVDAMNGAGPPGTIYRLDADALSKDRRTLMSLHEVGLLDVLSVGELLGWRPRTRILGVQPLEVRAPGLELTPALQAALPKVVGAVVEELESMNVRCKPSNSPAPGRLSIVAA